MLNLNLTEVTVTLCMQFNMGAFGYKGGRPVVKEKEGHAVQLAFVELRDLYAGRQQARVCAQKWWRSV